MKRLPPPPRNGIPLLDHLAASLALSRRAAKNLLDARLVFVNGKRIWMAKHPLQRRDALELLSGVPAPPPKAPPAIAPAILQDSPHWLVANKAAGVLANGPRSLEAQLRKITANPALHAVHRLDRDTTGCLLFAKDNETRNALIAQFEALRVSKYYHALIAGIPPEKTFAIRQPLDHRPALSEVRVLSLQPRPPRCAHIAVRIETGRTHQIRRHLQAIGTPVLGDRLYYSRATAAFRNIPRQMLHAARLRFTDPANNRPILCEAPLPSDFRTALRLLGLH